MHPAPMRVGVARDKSLAWSWARAAGRGYVQLREDSSELADESKLDSFHLSARYAGESD